MTEVRENLAHLFSLGRFDDVRVDATLAGERVALVYELSPIHEVTRIEFAGLGRRPRRRHRRAPPAATDRYGPSPPLGRAVDVATVVAEALRERGYLHVRVTPTPRLHHDPDRATLVLTLDAGARTTIGAIDVVAPPTCPARRSSTRSASRPARRTSATR